MSTTPQHAVGIADILPPFILEQAPLQKSEKIEDYAKLTRSLAAEIQPANQLEWRFLKDLIDAVWESQRLRRVRIALLETAQRDVVEQLLKESLSTDLDDTIKAVEMITGARTKAFAWATDSVAKAKIDDYLAKQGYSPDEILARGYQCQASALEHLERLIVSAEARKLQALANFSHYGRAFLLKIKQVTGEIIEADFKELPKRSIG